MPWVCHLHAPRLAIAMSCQSCCSVAGDWAVSPLVTLSAWISLPPAMASWRQSRLWRLLFAANSPLADLRGKMRKFPQSMVNVKLPRKIDLSGNAAVQSAVSDMEAKLGSKGRVLLRPSGTEPVVRVMVEGEDLDTVNRLAQELSDLVAAEVASAN